MFHSFLINAFILFSNNCMDNDGDVVTLVGRFGVTTDRLPAFHRHDKSVRKYIGVPTFCHSLQTLRAAL